jgi:hypothetical protein
MRKRNPLIRPRARADFEVAAAVLEILCGALVVPCGLLPGAQIMFANYADREFFFAAINSFVAVGP